MGWLVRGYLSACRRRAGPSTSTVAVAPATSSLRSVVVKRNPDRHTLRQPHPVEGRIDVGKQGRAGAAIAVFDTGRNAFHPSTQHMVAAHQPHIDGIADMDALQLGFLEIALDVQRV